MKLAPFHVAKNSNIEQRARFFSFSSRVVHRDGRFFLAGYNFHYGVSILLARSSWLASRRTNERGTSLALLCHRLPERWSVKVEERSGKRPLPTESKKRGPGTLEPRNTHVLLSSRVDRTGPLYISSTGALLLRNRLYACTGMII